MRHLIIALSCFVCGAALAAEPPKDENAAQEKSVAAAPEGRVSAEAKLKPTQGNAAQGALSLTPGKSGVRIAGTIEGLEPNAEHGFHVHEKGDCSAPDASSAGGHFNPTGQPHGNPKTGDQHHLGDMVNLRADAKGTAKVDAVIHGATLRSGRTDDVHGKAVVVHAKPDDYRSQPSGDSGARIACGVIQ